MFDDIRSFSDNIWSIVGIQLYTYKPMSKNT